MSDVYFPDGWALIKFTDVLDVQGGTQPPKSQFLDSPKEGYIRLLQIRDFGAKPVPTYIPVTSKLKICSKNDLLIGRYGASLGRICTGMEGAYNVALAKVISGEQLYKPFLKSYLESEIFQQPLALLSRSAQNGFNKDDLATFDFPLPPPSRTKSHRRQTRHPAGSGGTHPGPPRTHPRYPQTLSPIRAGRSGEWKVDGGMAGTIYPTKY